MGLLYSTSQWIVTPLFLLLLLLSSECGFRVGLRSHSSGDDTSRSQVSTVQSALLALFGLLLAFTVSMAVSRYDARKQLVVEESNAIGTTYLRAQLLPDPYRSEATQLLREYVDARLEFYAAGADQERIRQATGRAASLQGELWTQAVTVSRIDTRAVTTALYIESLNAAIDLPARRLAALENRVPDAVLALLLVGALLSVGIVGFGSGLGGQRQLALTLVFSLLIALVVMTVLDLDRPRRGLITVSQESMLQLQENLRGLGPEDESRSLGPHQMPKHLSALGWWARRLAGGPSDEGQGPAQKERVSGAGQGGLAYLPDTAFLDG